MIEIRTVAPELVGSVRQCSAGVGVSLANRTETLSSEISLVSQAAQDLAEDGVDVRIIYERHFVIDQVVQKDFSVI